MSSGSNDTGNDSEGIDQVMGDENLNAAAQGSGSENLSAEASLKIELAQANERALRAQAELENFRKRIYRDTDQQLKFATVGLLKDILEVSDNLARALDAASSSEASSGVAQGIKMVQSQLLTVLGKHNCQPIEAMGKPFDPNFHEALTQMPSSEYPAGTIVQELRKGYMLHDRVVRPSQVILSSGAPGGTS
jgi:molecular chaperone GrpE